MKSIYVGNIPYTAKIEQIQDLFAQFGEVVSIRTITDKETGKPKGYAFIEMEDSNASTAISMLNDSNFLGRKIKVGAANDNTQKDSKLNRNDSCR